jgi:hypothetical protein
MEYVRQTVSGAELNNFIALPPLLRNKKVQIIVLPATDDDIEDVPNYKCNIGFAKGAEITDSFFEPLPEEDLQAWGL